MVDTTILFSKLEQRRQELDMSKTAVAKRANISRPTVNRILSGMERSPGMQQINAIAAALGVQIRLGENPGLKEVRAIAFKKRQAKAKARRLLKMVQGTMALEAQAVDSDTIDQLVEETACKLIAGSSRRLWEE